MHNWIERKRSDGEKKSIRDDLAATMGEMKKCKSERDVDRVIPRVRFAQNTGLSKLSSGLKYILAKLANKTRDEMMTRETTYAAWYQQLRDKTVLDVTLELKVTVNQFALCLGLGWNPDVFRAEFGFEEQQIVQISKLVSQMTLNKILSLMLAFGQQKFNAGPLMLLLDVTIECNLEGFFSYLVMARGDMDGLMAFAKLLEQKDAQGHAAQLETIKRSIWHWIYCTSGCL